MLQKFEIQAVHTKVDPNLKKYVTKKIGSLDRYLSRHDRASAHGEVILKESKTKDNNNFVCEVTLHLPHGTIVVREAALNMYASVDIVETKLKQQIKKHKDLHENGKVSRRLMARFTRKTSLKLEQLAQPEA
jgi:ribosomal subunit interface protein